MTRGRRSDAPQQKGLERVADALADRVPVDWGEARESLPEHGDRLESFQLLDEVGRAFEGAGGGPAGEAVLFAWGPLEVVEKVGAGSFGEVYRAVDRHLGREVALKLRREASTDAGSASQWLEEGRRLAAIRHPNVLTVHGAGRHDGREGIWSDLIDGEPLDERILRDGPLGAEEVTAVGASLLEALAAIHAAGMVHGDVKPSNIVREVGGRIVLVDLGSGAAIGSSPTGSTQGSPLTSAPEVLRGEPPSPRSDLYSLGLTLFYLAAGRPPLEADSYEQLVERSSAGEMTPLRDLRPDVPAPLIAVIEGALAADPERRFESAGAMERALRGVDTSVPAPDVPPTARARSWARWAAIAAAGIVALAAAAAIVALTTASWWGRSASNSGSDGGPASYRVRRLSVRGSPVLAAVSPDGRYVAYLADVGSRRHIRLQQVATGSDIELVEFDSSIRFNQLAFSADSDYVRYSNGPSDALNSVWQVPVLGGPPRRLFDGLLLGPTYSPDGAEAAFISGTHHDDRWRRLDIVTLEDGARRTLLELEGEVDIEDLAWSPTGERLALNIADSSADHLMMLSSDGGEPEAVPGKPFFAINTLCWAPDGRRLIVVGAETAREFVLQPWLVDVPSGTRRRLVSDVFDYDGCSTDVEGRLTASVRREVRSRLSIVPLDRPDGAQEVTTTTGRSDGVHRVAWLDGETLVYTAPDANTRNLWQVAAVGGTAERLTAAGADGASSSRGGRLAFESGWSRDERQGIYVMDVAIGGARRVSPPGRWASTPAISPDGRRVLYEVLADERVEFVLQELEGDTLVVPLDTPAHAGSFSPDGSHFAVHALNPELERWQTAILSVEGGAPVRWLDVHSDSFSPWAGEAAILISSGVDGVDNIFRVDFDDPTPKPITAFDDGRIFSFDLSPDGTRLAVAHGEQVNDLLLYEGLVP